MFFLIGQRGVGKTSIASELEGAVDLDAEISKNSCINSYFESGNEAGFRNQERETLTEILKDKKHKLVSLGAGFELDNFEFPQGSIFIWVQRKSDLTGRVFINGRPRLESKLSPLDEYFFRFEERQKLYSKTASFSLEMVEGAPVSAASAVLKRLLSGAKIHSKEAYYTIESEKSLDFFSGCVELRTDILNEQQILLILKKKSENSYIVSIRSKVSDNFIEDLLECDSTLVDLPMEDQEFLIEFLDLNRGRLEVFASCHEGLEPKDLIFLKDKGLHLKWAPVVESFESLRSSQSLIKGADVSFLPRDSNAKGRWKWVRESFFNTNKINFYRAGLSEFLDQPNIFDLEFLTKAEQVNKGAVVGENVFLSKSPGFHRRFFKKTFNSFYSSIPLGRDEFKLENLEMILDLGYKCLSITAPFKSELKILGSEKSANTVYLNQGQNFFEDTDRRALVDLAEIFEKKEKVLIWGAGSMGQWLKDTLGDRADLLSVRSYDGAALSGYDSLVWCAGADAERPKFHILPSKIVDLEYKEHSKAKQVAIDLGTQYISGEDFFTKQAEAQQRFWLQQNKEQP